MKLMDSIYWQFEKRKYLRWLIPLLVCAIVVSVSVWGYIDHTRPDAKEDDINTIHELILVYYDVPNPQILEATPADIEDLHRAMCEVKYRICGVATDVDTKWEFWDTCNLVAGGEKIHCYVEKNQNLKEGEYVEFVGKISFDEYGHDMYSVTITDRGSAVRERLESEE